MDDPGLGLQVARHRQEARADHDRPQPLEHLWPDDDVGDARLVLQRHEDDARRRPRPLTHEHEAGHGDASERRSRQDGTARNEPRRAGSFRRRYL